MDQILDAVLYESIVGANQNKLLNVQNTKKEEKPPILLDLVSQNVKTEDLKVTWSDSDASEKDDCEIKGSFIVQDAKMNQIKDPEKPKLQEIVPKA